MPLIKPVIYSLLASSLILGQGTMNAFGLGHFYNNQGIGSAGNGVNDLAPSFQSNVSLANPSTWHHLKFTHLSLSYSGDKNSVSEPSLLNGYSGLSNAVWIVPIKTKWSFGLAVSPYADQRISISSQESEPFIAFGETLNLVKSIDRAGGILAFKIGTSYLIRENFSMGLFMDMLFGSSRQNESVFFDGSSIIQTSRIRYSGVLSKIFISTAVGEKINLFTSLQYPIKPLDGLYTAKHLFDDANGNGYHDYSSPTDFPLPDSVSAKEEIRFTNLHEPSQYAFGIQSNLNKSTAIALELNAFKDDGDLSRVTLPMNDWINSSNQIKLSLTRFPNDLSMDLIDKFSFRSGFSLNTHTLAKSGIGIREVGGALGFGFKFKATGNQIDMNYYLGKRDYTDNYKTEIVQQIQLGISLADLWFVKRRQK